jgi:hypothetical protein
MYLVISRLKFNHSPDAYSVEAQSEDFDKLCEMLKALQLLNTEKDKTFHPLHMDGKTADQLKD